MNSSKRIIGSLLENFDNDVTESLNSPDIEKGQDIEMKFMRLNSSISFAAPQFAVEVPHAPEEKSSKGSVFAIMSAIIGSSVPLVLAMLYRCSKLTSFEIVYWEATFMIIANLITAKFCGHSVIDLPSDLRKLAVLRAFFGGIAFMCSFAAVQYIPMSKANVLCCTGTLYIPFLAKYFLGESFKRIDIVALFCGFCGIILMNKPGQALATNDISKEIIGAALGLTCGVSAAFGAICVRKLTKV